MVEWIGDTYPAQSIVAKTNFYVDGTFHSEHSGRWLIFFFFFFHCFFYDI